VGEGTRIARTGMIYLHFGEKFAANRVQVGKKGLWFKKRVDA